MPRVNVVKKARKAQRPCGKCGCEINPGDGYEHWSFRYGGKRVRCLKRECAPKRSDLTQSWYFAQLFDIQDTPVDQTDLEGARDDVVARLEELRDECQERLDNMPESLQYSPNGELIQERIDSIEGAISELEDIEVEIDEDEQEPEERAASIADDISEALCNVY